MDGPFELQSTVAQKVYAIIAAQALLDVAEISDEATIDSLGLDSLGVVETLFAIEETFDISVPFNANNPSERRFDISTVGAMVKGVEALIAAK